MATSRRALAPVAAATFGAVLWVAASPVGADPPIEHEHFHDQGSEPFTDCPGLAVRSDFDVQGSFLVRTGGEEGLVFFMEHVHGTNAFTNLANGKTFTLSFTFLTRDASVIDNGDGTLSITVHATGRQFVVGPDGERLFHDAGLGVFEILVDHAGTPTNPEDDVFLAATPIRQAGRNETGGRDFCEDLQQFIG